MNVVIVGAGAGGKKLIEALVNHNDISIVYVVDIQDDAIGMALARKLNIPTANDYRHIFVELGNHKVDVILEVTGQADVYQTLLQVAQDDTIVISGLALRFFMLFIEDKIALIHELEARQQELQLVLNATHDGMAGVNREAVVTLFNAAAAKLAGVPIEQAVGRPVDEVIPNSRLARVVASGKSELNQVQQLNGIEIVTNRVPVLDENQEIIGAISVFRDVTELRQLAAEVTNLREVQTLLEAVIQSTQDAISVVDSNGRGIMINPAYTRLTGLTEHQVIGQSADVDIAEGESMHLQVLQTRKAVRSVPMKVGPKRKEVLVDVAPILVGNDLRGSVGVIHDVSEIKRLTDELEKANQLLRTVEAKYAFDDIVGVSQAMVMAIDQAKSAAQTPATVLLRGESGTGKELFAHAIHHASARKYKAFVRVNCASLSESLLESELFGYEEGAFTGAKRGGKRGLFEEASGGTLFLDEIGEMSLTTQAKLLRTLQEQEIVRVGGVKSISVDVRVIAATHVNLEQAVATKRFREDLYYRLNVLPIFIPPLRYRHEDIESIVRRIIIRLNQMYDRNVIGISLDALQVLQDYDWPGNVRELENIIGRAMIHMGYNDTMIEVHHLPVMTRFVDGTSPVSVQGQPVIPLQGTLADIVRKAEKAAIKQTLADCGGNKTAAARRLGISVRSLYYKMEAQNGSSID